MQFAAHTRRVPPPSGGRVACYLSRDAPLPPGGGQGSGVLAMGMGLGPARVVRIMGHNPRSTEQRTCAMRWSRGAAAVNNDCVAQYSPRCGRRRPPPCWARGGPGIRRGDFWGWDRWLHPGVPAGAAPARRHRPRGAGGHVPTAVPRGAAQTGAAGHPRVRPSAVVGTGAARHWRVGPRACRAARARPQRDDASLGLRLRRPCRVFGTAASIRRRRRRRRRRWRRRRPSQFCCGTRHPAGRAERPRGGIGCC